MHGAILVELRKFVDTTVSATAWADAHKAAGLPVTPYLPIATYEKHVLPSLLKALSDITGAPVTALLDEFGCSIAPRLLAYPGIHIPKQWRTMSLLENVEGIIHKTVRRNDPKANPPRLRVTRTSFDNVVIHYSSPLKLCAFAKGIVRGFAKHFGEAVVIHEDSCMIVGDLECQIVVRLRPSAVRSAVKLPTG